jgi:hypothetical protein
MSAIRKSLARLSVLSLVLVWLSPEGPPIAAELTKDAIAAVWKTRQDGV